jgi:hypothetical protein
MTEQSVSFGGLLQYVHCRLLTTLVGTYPAPAAAGAGWRGPGVCGTFQHASVLLKLCRVNAQASVTILPTKGATLNIAGSLITAGVALMVAIGGYIQLVIRRSIFPCIEFDACLVGMSRSAPDQLVAEVILSIKNVGPGVGFVVDPRCRIAHRRAGSTDLRGVEPGFEPPLAFPMVATQTVENYIQPGVTQWYRKPLVIPADVHLVHIWAAFDYHIRVGLITWFLARLITGRPKDRVVKYNVRRTFDAARFPEN